MKQPLPHPHAKLAQEYWTEAAIDINAWKNWEYQTIDGVWRSCTTAPRFETYIQYRRKPKTIKIGNYDVPEPIREALKNGTGYYIPSFVAPNKVWAYSWDGGGIDQHVLECGLIHLTAEAARLHAEALISLTKSP